MAFCVRSTKSFFCNPKNQFAEFVRSAEGQDKLAKFAAEGAFPVIIEVARLSGASEQTMGNLATGHNAVKLSRDVFGLLHIFRGAIPGMVLRGREIGTLISGLRSGGTVNLQGPKRQRTVDPTSMTALWREGGNEVRQNVGWASENPHNPLPAHYTLEARAALKHNDKAVGRTEMLLKLGENAGGMIGSATFIAGFGLARPAANARKYLDLEFGGAGNKIADSFPYIMCANHVGGIIQNSFELAYQIKAYERGLADEAYDPEDVEKDFMFKLVDTLLNLFEKVLELINDVLLFINVAAPAWFKIPLNLTISTLGLVRVWRKTA